MVFLLVVLNLGAALWWATRDDVPGEQPRDEERVGVARLQLVSEAPMVERCFALGPFADAEAAGVARAALPASILRAQTRQSQPVDGEPADALHWLDVAIAGTADEQAIRDALGAERIDPAPCAGTR